MSRFFVFVIIVSAVAVQTDAAPEPRVESLIKATLQGTPIDTLPHHVDVIVENPKKAMRQTAAHMKLEDDNLANLLLTRHGRSLPALTNVSVGRRQVTALGAPQTPVRAQAGGLCATLCGSNLLLQAVPPEDQRSRR